MVQAYISEISNQQHQALGISMIGTSWGLALIIGPALGGYLSQPALKYPSVFGEGSLFARYPYFLPSLCNTVLATGVLCIIIQLPETLHKHNIEEMEESATEQMSVMWPQCSKSTEGKCSKRRYSVGFSE
jgi:MFS family permease